MGKKVYKAADVQIITEGSVVDFDLFITNETKTTMSVLIAKNSVVDGTMKVRLRDSILMSKTRTPIISMSLIISKALPKMSVSLSDKKQLWYTPKPQKL